MRIENFNKTRLKVATHIKVMERFDQRIGQLTIEKFGTEAITVIAAERYDAFHKAIAREAADYKQQQGSEITAQIAEQDTIRDRAWGTICTVARTFVGMGTVEQQAAAKDLMKVIDLYKVNTSAQYDQESGMLDQVIADIQYKHLDALQFLSLEQVFSTLCASTDKVDELLDQRDNERAFVSNGVVKADRAATDAAYDAFIDVINAILLLHPNEDIDRLAAEWNSVLNRIRVQVLGANGNESVDVDVDAPSSADKPSNGNGGNSSGTGSQSGSGSGSGSGNTGSNSGGGDYSDHDGIAEW